MKKKKIIILSIAIIGLLLIATGVTYAFLNINFEGTKINSLYVPSISLTYSESGNALTIDTPSYIICGKCKYNKCISLDYHPKRGYHHVYKED